jgi:hypothetical protein
MDPAKVAIARARRHDGTSTTVHRRIGGIVFL